MINEVASRPFAHLQEETTVLRNQVRVGGVSLQFASVDSAAIALLPPLDQFQVEAGVPDIAIQVERLPELPVSPARQLFDSGYTSRLYDTESGLRFDFFARACGRAPQTRMLRT